MKVLKTVCTLSLGLCCCGLLDGWWALGRLEAQEGVWGEKTRLSSTINNGDWALTPAVSADGSTMIFQADSGSRPGGNGSRDLWIATLQPDGEFGAVRALADVNSSAFDGQPSLSADDSRLYFSSQRSASSDIFVARRSGDTYGEPEPLAGAVNTELSESFPVISQTGLELFFQRESSIYLATRSDPDATFEDVVAVENLNLASGEWPSSLSSDGRVLFFSHTDGSTFAELYTATREGPGAPFEAPVRLSAPVDVGFHPYISRDWPATGSKLWFVLCTPCEVYEATWEAADPAPGFFTDARMADGVNQSGAYDFAPTASADGLEIVFTSFRDGGQGASDLWAATRARVEDPFDPPQNIANVNSEQADAQPELTANGLEMFFARRRSSDNIPDLFVASRPESGVGDPSQFEIVRSLDEINTDSEEFFPSISGDGLELYFTSDRGGGTGIYVAERSASDPNALFGAPRLLAELSAGATDPDVSANGLSLFFLREDMIWRVDRPTRTSAFGLPLRVVDTDFGHPSIARDWPAPGSKLYFSRLSNGGSSSDIWEATWVSMTDCVVASGAEETDCDQNGYADACEIAKGAAVDVNQNGMPDDCELAFRRGECNDDGQVDVSDASCILNWQFLGGPAPGCLAATNTNGDSGSDIADAIYLLSSLFLGGPAPAPPFPGCGPGTKADTALGCEVSTCK